MESVLHLDLMLIQQKASEGSLWRPKEFREAWGTSDSKLEKSLTWYWNSNMGKIDFELLIISTCSLNY